MRYTPAFVRIRLATRRPRLSTSRGAGVEQTRFSLIGCLPPMLVLVVTNLTVSARTNLVFQGLNEVAACSAVVWSSTKLALPLNQWTSIWTNGLASGDSAFTATNVVSANVRQQFCILQLRQIQ